MLFKGSKTCCEDAGFWEGEVTYARSSYSGTGLQDKARLARWPHNLGWKGPPRVRITTRRVIPVQVVWLFIVCVQNSGFDQLAKITNQPLIRPTRREWGGPLLVGAPVWQVPQWAASPFFVGPAGGLSSSLQSRIVQKVTCPGGGCRGPVWTSRRARTK